MTGKGKAMIIDIDDVDEATSEKRRAPPKDSTSEATVDLSPPPPLRKETPGANTSRASIPRASILLHTTILEILKNQKRVIERLEILENSNEKIIAHHEEMDIKMSFIKDKVGSLAGDRQKGEISPPTEDVAAEEEGDEVDQRTDIRAEPFDIVREGENLCRDLLLILPRKTVDPEFMLNVVLLQIRVTLTPPHIVGDDNKEAD